MFKKKQFDDILIVGSGHLAQCIIYSLSKMNGTGKVTVLSRNQAQCDSIVTTANVVAHSNGAGYVFSWEQLSDNYDNLEELIIRSQPKILLNCLSLQSPWRLGLDSKWGQLVANYGFGSTIVFQLPIALRISNIIEKYKLSSFYINACYPDVANPILKQLGLPINSGIGNVAIIDELIRNVLKLSSDTNLQIIGHHYHVNQIIKPPEQRSEFPRVWIDDKELYDVPDIIKNVQLPSSSFINQITGNNTAKFINNLIIFRKLTLNLPGINGFSGGMPVEITDFYCKLVLPESVQLSAVNQINQDLERREGIVERNEYLILSESVHRYLGQIDQLLSKPIRLDNLSDYLLDKKNISKLINHNHQ
ncbi:hypothetical protein JMN32_14725 [Fulvivirga sp. 29W222]|uniref:Saccharopine dehydrogenase NADP binding domain-containing protein n=1 Tax=Fulvivirga marina TaxID=2494733 RepID=A0A937G066_9BACT|nr:hypothetical protein [Fulvivirga marina]MBL6447570.1 hypothetical protein [Fulvivirga marina]